MRIRLALVLSVLAAPLLAAQELSVRTWGVRDGLIQSRVNDIRRDSNGYVWFATWEGASRFDGRRFVDYGSREGLPNPLVWCVAEAPDGRIWLATHGGGIARVSDSGAALVSDPIGDRNPAERAFEIAFDRDGRMWLATNRGAFVSESSRPGELRFEHADELGPDWYGRLLLDAHADLWLVAGDEVVRCRGRALERMPIAGALPGTDDDEVRAVAARRDGGAWVARTRYLSALDLPREAGSGATSRPEPIDFGPNTSLYDVREDDAGRLWVATSRGLLRIHGAEQRWFTSAQGLPDDWIHSIAFESGGGTWIGTHNGGAAFLPDSGCERYTARGGLGDGHAVKLLALDADRWLVPTEVAGIFEIANGRARLVPGSDAPPFDRIQRYVARDAASDWWIGTSDGIRRIPGPAFDLARAEIVGAARGLPQSARRVLGLDASHHALVASDDGRVFAEDPDTGRFEALPFEVQGGSVSYLALLDRRNAWLSDGNHLWRAVDGRLEEIAPWPESAGEVLPRVLRFDSRGWLWLGTRFGGAAFVRDPAAISPRFERLTARDGLASDAVFAIAEDRAGSIYLGTGRGVQRYRTQAGTLESVGAEQGLGDEWVTDLQFDARGDLWVADAQGVLRIPAGEARPARPAPRVRFTRCVVAGAEVALPAAGSPTIPDIEVDAQDSRLAFEFVAVDPVRGDRLLYQTRLDGLDAAWSEPSRELSARYGQLAPGEYRFAVRCVDPGEGASVETASSLRIAVVPPLWARPWFLALAVLAAGGLAFAAHRLRLRRELALERVRTQIASDLHDDIGAGLAQIAISSEYARRAPANEAHEVLGEVAQTARDLRSSMSDLVWAVDPRNDTLADLAGRMRQFASDAISGAGQVLDFRAPDERELTQVRMSPDRRRNLFLSFKEATANVARHARAAHVRIELDLGPGRVRLVIQDDGRGFDASAPNAGRGLRNLRRRAAELCGELTIESAPGAGTRIVLDAPLWAPDR